jgi:hypothetical protein
MSPLSLCTLRNKQRLILHYVAGPKPTVTKGTRVILPVTDQKELTTDKNRWDVRIHRQDGNTLTFQVRKFDKLYWELKLQLSNNRKAYGLHN